MALTDRDAEVILRIFQCRLVPAQATFLFARAFDPMSGGDHWSRRLRVLYDAGWISRFYVPQSRYVSGSQWPVYAVESGVAARASELRQPWRNIDRATRARLYSASAGTRQRIVQMLAERSSVGVDEIHAGLRATTDLALKLYSGDPCHATHTLLAATLNAILWHGLRTAGLRIDTILGDGSVDLADLTDGAISDSLFPDTLFVVKNTLVCVEAETGTTNRTKLREKITRYVAVRSALRTVAARLGYSLKRMRVVFHCASTRHKQLVANLVADEVSGACGMFLFSEKEHLHLEFPQIYFRRNLPLDGEAGDGAGFYDALASLTRRAIFAQVEGRQGTAARLGFVSFEQAIGE